MKAYAGEGTLSEFARIVKEAIADAGGGSGGGTVNWDDINGRPDLSTVSSMVFAPVVLSSTVWSADRKQTVPIEGILADENAQLIIPIPKSASEAAYNAAGVQCISQAENLLTFQADTVPTVDLSLNVYILGAADVKKEFAGDFVWISPRMTSANTPEPYVVTPDAGTENGSNGGKTWQLFSGDPEKGMYIRRNANGPSVQIDFGQAELVRGLSLIRCEHYADFIPRGFDFEGSIDGTTWSLISRIEPDISSADEQQFEFDNLTYYRYYRLTNFTSYNGNTSPTSEDAIIFNNVRFYILTQFVWWSPKMTSENTPAPYVVTAGGFQSRPELGGGEPWKMWDDDDTTGWIYQADREQLWNSIDLGQERVIKGIALYPTQKYQYPPASFDLFASNDGNSWTYIKNIDGFTGAAELQKVEFDKYFTARYVKIANVQESPNINGFAGINEIELYVMKWAEMEVS